MTRAEAFGLKLRVLAALSLKTPHSAAWVAGDIDGAETQVYYYLRQLADDGLARAVMGRKGGYVLSKQGRTLLTEALGRE